MAAKKAVKPKVRRADSSQPVQTSDPVADSPRTPSTVFGVDGSALYANSVTSGYPPADYGLVRAEAAKYFGISLDDLDAVAWISSPERDDEKFARFRVRVDRSGFRVIDVVGAFSFLADYRDVVDSLKPSDPARNAIRLRGQRADPSIAFAIGRIAKTHRVAILTDSIQVGLILAAAGQLRKGINTLFAIKGTIAPSNLQALKRALERGGLEENLEITELEPDKVFPWRDRPVTEGSGKRQMFATFGE